MTNVSGRYFRVNRAQSVSGDFLYVPPQTVGPESWSGLDYSYPWSYGGKSGSIPSNGQTGNTTATQSYLSISFDAPATLTVNGVKYGFLCHARIRESTNAAAYSIDRSTVTTIPYERLGHYYFYTSIYYKLAQYTVTVKASPSYGGTVMGGATVYEGDTVTVNATPATHFAFSHWQTTGGTTVSTAASYTFTPTASVTLVAVFTSTESIVAFDATGGSASPAFATAYFGDAYGTLPTPTRSGYTFAGWWTAASGGTQVTASTVVTATADHTLYAHWTTDSVTTTLTFDAAGGTVSPSSKQVTSGSTYGTLPTPTRSGYIFAGWYTRATGGDAVTAATVAGDEDATIYAHWTGESLTITFNANGGTVTETTRTVERGHQYRRLPFPTRSGYAFDGWFTAATGGTQVTAGGYPSASITLYAHWTAGGGVPWFVVSTF